MTARNTYIQITINAHDVSADLAPYLIGFTFTDNAHGKTDDVNITLHDRDDIWKKKWLPEKGDSITVNIKPSGFKVQGQDDPVLQCGSFQIDEVGVRGFPQTLEIKGVSIPIDGNLRREKRSQTWSKTTLKHIASDITKKGTLTLNYQSDNIPYYPSRYQHDESDLAFLQRLCEQAGLSLKISDKQLIIFDELEFELKPEQFFIDKSDNGLISYDIRTQSHEIFRACTVRYHNPEAKKSHVYTYTPPNPPKVGQILNIDERVETVSDAQRLAKKRLREKNKYETTGSLTLIGNTSVYAGVNFGLTGFGRLDGKYHIDKVVHSATNGYNTTLEFHKCIEF